MTESYAEQLQLDLTTVKNALTCLQTNALDKLKAQSKFKNTGVATLKVRIPQNEKCNAHTANMEISLNALGQELREAVASKLEVDPTRYGFIILSKY